MDYNSTDLDDLNTPAVPPLGEPEVWKEKAPGSET